MRPLLPVLGIAAIASVLYVVTAASGGQHARPPTGRQFAALQQQVRTLQMQVRTIQQNATLLKRQVGWTLQLIEDARIHGQACFVALTADEFQNTWSQIDHLAVSAGEPAIFGTQTAIDDKNACRELAVPRRPLSPSIAPTVTPLSRFMLWLHN